MAFSITIVLLLVAVLTTVSLIAERRQQPVEIILQTAVSAIRTEIKHAIEIHPFKPLAIIETIFWILMLLPLIEHVLRPDGGVIAQFAWFLVIGPHELGHILCMPFGQFIMFAGGSIWQILFWALLGSGSIFVRRQIGLGLLFWLIVGHSFINVSVYIRDASDRNLPLLFGMSKDHHDWYNLLNQVGLLDYDWLLADFAVIMGVIVTLLVISGGILSAWFVPRHKLGARF